MIRRILKMDTKVSTTVYGDLSFGSGKLDDYGFWEFPDYEAARKWEEEHPGVVCWPLEKKNI